MLAHRTGYQTHHKVYELSRLFHSIAQHGIILALLMKNSSLSVDPLKGFWAGSSEIQEKYTSSIPAQEPSFQL